MNHELLFCARCEHDEYDHDDEGGCYIPNCKCPGFEAERSDEPSNSAATFLWMYE